LFVPGAVILHASHFEQDQEWLLKNTAMKRMHTNSNYYFVAARAIIPSWPEAGREAGDRVGLGVGGG